MTAPGGTGRTAGGKIRIPFQLTQPGIIADGMREIGPDDPRYAAWDEWLTARDAEPAAEEWTVAGKIPDTGEQVTLTWRDGVDNWPADALDWALAAATAGEVQLDDGPRLRTWLLGQGFDDVTAQVARAVWNPARHPRDTHGRFAGLRTPSAAELRQLAGTARDGGFTYSTVNHTSPAAGYALSPYPERSRVIDTADLTGGDIRTYIAANADLLNLPDHYLGAWRERDGMDRVWLDVSVVTSDRAAAEQAGREHNQLAAYDIAAGEEIQLGGTGEARRAAGGGRPRLTRYLVKAAGLDADAFAAQIKSSG